MEAAQVLGLDPQELSAWSKDPDAKVGAVIVSKSRRILSIGYNGLPAAMPDTDEYLNSDNKLDYMIHAEMNSIYNAGLAGVSLKNSTIYYFHLWRVRYKAKTS